MTTYSSYEAAKIANPESDIYAIKSNEHSDKESFSTLEFMKGHFNNYYMCHPSTYCTSALRFFNEGYELTSGDIVITFSGKVMVIKDEDLNRIKNSIAINSSISLFDKEYILRAAALEDKPKRTNVEHIKHNVNEDGGKFWEVARDWSEGNCEFRFMRGNGDYELIDSNEELLMLYTNRKLYRRIETEIDERQEFIDTYMSFVDSSIGDSYDKFAGKLYDSGKFKLVKGE